MTSETLAAIDEALDPLLEALGASAAHQRALEQRLAEAERQLAGAAEAMIAVQIRAEERLEAERSQLLQRGRLLERGWVCDLIAAQLEESGWRESSGRRALRQLRERVQEGPGG
jgi:hypothetical protein